MCEQWVTSAWHLLCVCSEFLPCGLVQGESLAGVMMSSPAAFPKNRSLADFMQSCEIVLHCYPSHCVATGSCMHDSKNVCMEILPCLCTACSVGMVFMPNDDALEAQCKGIYEAAIEKEGMKLIGWRQVSQTGLHSSHD